MGFDAQGTLYCDNVSVSNPTAGLVLRNLSPRNQFFLLYVNIVLQNKADPLLRINNTKLNRIQIRHSDKIIRT